MTLIAGVICQDGVVVGADSITTISTDIEQQVSDKITIAEDNVIIACSGNAGLSQLIKDELRGRWHEIQLLRSTSEVRNAISEAMYSQIELAAKRARSAGNSPAKCETLVALPVSHRPTLLHFSPVADSWEIGSELAFISIGSGSRQADPFLAFIKRILWGGAAPCSTRLATFGILWTLQHVSTVNAGLGVGGPPRIAALANQGGSWNAEMLTEGRLGEHRLAIAQAEATLQNFAGRGGPSQSF